MVTRFLKNLDNLNKIVHLNEDKTLSSPCCVDTSRISQSKQLQLPPNELWKFPNQKAIRFQDQKSCPIDTYHIDITQRVSIKLEGIIAKFDSCMYVLWIILWQDSHFLLWKI